MLIISHISYCHFLRNQANDPFPPGFTTIIVFAVATWTLDANWDALWSWCRHNESFNMKLSGYVRYAPLNMDMGSLRGRLLGLIGRDIRQGGPCSWQLSDAELFRRKSSKRSRRSTRSFNAGDGDPCRGTKGHKRRNRGNYTRRSLLNVSVSLGRTEIRAVWGRGSCDSRRRSNSLGVAEANQERTTQGSFSDSLKPSSVQRREKYSLPLCESSREISSYRLLESMEDQTTAGQLQIYCELLWSWIVSFAFVNPYIDVVYRYMAYSLSRCQDCCVGHRLVGLCWLQLPAVGNRAGISVDSFSWLASQAHRLCSAILCRSRRVKRDVERASSETKMVAFAGNEKITAEISFELERSLEPSSSVEERLEEVGIKRGSSSCALGSLGMDFNCSQYIKDSIPDEMLLQFGVLLGESESATAAKALKIPGPFDASHSLLGRLECGNKEDWSHIVDEENEDLELQAWRLPLRKGLYVYLTRAVLHGVAPGDVKAFQLDDSLRKLWDQSVVYIERASTNVIDRQSGDLGTDHYEETDLRERMSIEQANEGDKAQKSAHHCRLQAKERDDECLLIDESLASRSESCLHRYVSRFPGPMASREYSYARRVWHREADDGCYVICRQCEFPVEHVITNRIGQRSNPSHVVKVQEFVSCMAIKSSSVESRNGTEVVSIYFEDSHVRPALAKMAVPKGLWPFWQKYNASLRDFVKTMGRDSLEDVACPMALGLDGDSRRDCPVGAARFSYRSYGFGSTSSDDDYDDDGDVGDGRNSVLEGYSSDETALLTVYMHGRASKRRDRKAESIPNRWARRIIIAGAVRMMQIMLTGS